MIKNTTPQGKQEKTKLVNLISMEDIDKSSDKQILDTITHLTQRLNTIEETIEETKKHSKNPEDALKQLTNNLKQTLSPILGFSEILLTNNDYFEDIDKVNRLLGYINIAAKTSAKILDKVSDVEYLPKNIVRIDLNSLIGQITEIIQPDKQQYIKAKIRINKDLGSIAPILGNFTQLQNMFIDLLLKMIDSVPAGGTIHIKTWEDQKFTYIQIRNNGIGTSSENQEGDEERIDLAKSVISQHNGHMEITNQKNQGSSFTIRFPKVEQL